MTNRVTSYLVADHERLHALLATACAGEALDGEAFARFRAGLLRHIGIEEKLLLPSVRRNRGWNAISRARELRVEHAALTSLLVPTPDLALCREIRALLANHDAREEGPGGYTRSASSISPKANRSTSRGGPSRFRTYRWPRTSMAPACTAPQRRR